MKRVFWGREDKQICTEPPVGLTIDKKCETDPDNSMKKVHEQCRNMQACELVASNVFFNEPSCENAFKYLKICYECVPDQANAVDVLLQNGKRRKRGALLEDILKKRALEEGKTISRLWQKPYHGKVV